MQSTKRVSVPTGDFSFIYYEECRNNDPWKRFPSPPGTFLLSILRLASGKAKEVKVSVPTGDFSFIYHCLRLCKRYVSWVSVPTGDFSFIYKGKKHSTERGISFRPHRGLFFYL